MYACAAPRMFGPFDAPAGGAVMPASSACTDAGMLAIVQWRIGAPRTIASPSCMITTYDCVPAGPAVQDNPGNTFPLY